MAFTTAQSWFGGNPVWVQTDDGAGNMVALATGSGGGTVAAAFTNTTVSVGTGSTTVLAAAAATKIIILVNDSTNIIYVATNGSAAALNSGIRLNASGGSATLDKTVPTGQINAIATGAASNLTVSYA